MERRSAAPGTAGGTATLLVLVAVMGGAVAALALRAGHLVERLPATRVEPWLELLAVSVGLLAAAWVALSALVGILCVAARAAGRSWTAGERLVLHVAPQVVRRAARVGVGVSVGAGLVLGAGTAQAAEPPTPDAPPVVAVDLGWRPTAPDAVADAATSSPSDDGTGVPEPTSAPAPADVPEPAPSQARAGDGTDPAGTAPGDVPAASADPTGTTPAVEVPHEATDTTPTPPTTSAPAGATQRDAALTVTREATTGTADEVVVLRGDTLWSIASRHLPPGSTDAQVAQAVQRWFAANAGVVGGDPDLILPGQVLRAPTA